MDDPPELISPPTLRAERDGPSLPMCPWTRTIAPAYLTFFASAPFFDALWTRDVGRAGLPWLEATAYIAAVLAFALFYAPMALWGQSSRRGLGVLAASTFGTTGSEWITGVGLAIGCLVWYAVAIDYAVDSTFLGLSCAGLVPNSVLLPARVGPFEARGALFLATAAFWIFIAGTASLLRLIGAVAALMRMYAPVALVLLTAVALWLARGAGEPRIDQAAAGFRAFGLAHAAGPAPVFGTDAAPVFGATPLFLGFFAMAGLMGADWGAAAPRRRDVVIGGLVGTVLAGAWTALMALIVVAGALGHLASSNRIGPMPLGPPLSFRWSVAIGLGGRAAGAVLVLFGLAALAPACYAIAAFSDRFTARWPRHGRNGWTWIGGALALVLIAGACSHHLEAIGNVLGLVFAPALGAVAGDWLRQHGGWAGVRPGANPAGLVAWILGLISATIWAIVVSWGLIGADGAFRWFAGAVLCPPIIGFAVAAAGHGLLSRLGMEPPAIALAGGNSLDLGAPGAPIVPADTIEDGPNRPDTPDARPADREGEQR